MSCSCLGPVIRQRFIFTSLCFSLNIGTVTTLTAVASAQLGPKLGGFNIAVLYGTMVFSSMFFANWAVDLFGCKRCLVIGCSGFFIFTVGVTILATSTPRSCLKRTVLLLGMG